MLDRGYSRAVRCDQGRAAAKYFLGMIPYLTPYVEPDVDWGLFRMLNVQE
jgi:hypothetical protein